MHLVLAQILGLGKAPSAFGVTLALLLSWVVGIGGLIAALTWFSIAQVRKEHNENVARAKAFDERHSS